MKVLVIYDLIPEATLRTVVEMSEEEYEYFSKAHNHYVNSDTDADKSDIVNVIGNALCDKPKYIKYCETDKDREYFGKWKSDLFVTDITGVQKIIHCGFIL